MKGEVIISYNVVSLSLPRSSLVCVSSPAAGAQYPLFVHLVPGRNRPFFSVNASQWEGPVCCWVRARHGRLCPPFFVVWLGVAVSHFPQHFCLFLHIGLEVLRHSSPSSSNTASRRALAPLSKHGPNHTHTHSRTARPPPARTYPQPGFALKFG